MNNRTVLVVSLVSSLILGLILGLLVDRAGGPAPSTESANVSIWTCPMHPGVRSDRPNRCPQCGMDLVLMDDALAPSADTTTPARHIDAALREVGQITLASAGVAPVRLERRRRGRVAIDPASIEALAARVEGTVTWVAPLRDGDRATPGQVLVRLQSDALDAAARDLQRATLSQDTALSTALRRRLSSLGVSIADILLLERDGAPKNGVPLRTTHGGLVLERNVRAGDRTGMEGALFVIASEGSRSVEIDLTESDILHVHPGDPVRIRHPGDPHQFLAARIVNFLPRVDPMARTLRVRTTFPPGLPPLPPGAFLEAILEDSQGHQATWIPAEALVWTGPRSIVWVEDSTTPQHVRLRIVEPGPLVGDTQFIASGLHPGERVVARGAWLVDADAQLAGAVSSHEQLAPPVAEDTPIPHCPPSQTRQHHCH